MPEVNHPHQMLRTALAWFGDFASRQRGEPLPLGGEEKRPAFAQQHVPPDGLPHYRITRRYDRGAAAFAVETGQILYDPVGQGWIVPHRIDLPFRRTGAYLNGAIFWNTTTQNSGAQPVLGGLYTPNQLRQLWGYRTASAIVALPSGTAPGGIPTSYLQA